MIKGESCIHVITYLRQINSMAPLWVCPQVTICLTIVAMLCILQSNSVLTLNQELIEDELEDLYGLPGVQFEYRFEVGGGKSHCFYQSLRKDAQLHVAFEVRT